MVMRASLANHAKAGGAEGKRSQAAPKLEGGGGGEADSVCPHHTPHRAVKCGW